MDLKWTGTLLTHRLALFAANAFGFHNVIESVVETTLDGRDIHGYNRPPLSITGKHPSAKPASSVNGTGAQQAR